MNRNSTTTTTSTTRTRIARSAVRGVAASVVAGAAMLTLGGQAFAAPAGLLPAGPVGASTQQQILTTHNAFRDEVGVAHLSWDARLAGDAQAYADKLAASDIGRADHDRAELKAKNEGENLAWNFGTSDPVAAGMKGWSDEKAAFLAAPDKTQFSTTYGHYTQMVWSTTSTIGCGTAKGASGMTYVSCRYSTPGNQLGKAPYEARKDVDPTQCAYNPGGRGGYGSYVDGLALDTMNWELDMSNAINKFRRDHGVKELTYSRTLARPAMWASLDDYNRGAGPIGRDHLDGRGMNVPQRVKYCSGYTGGLIYEIAYVSPKAAGAKWQKAFDFMVANNAAQLLEPKFTTFSGVQMAYGGDDVNRAPAYYTVLLGDH